MNTETLVFRAMLCRSQVEKLTILTFSKRNPKVSFFALIFQDFFIAVEASKS